MLRLICRFGGLALRFGAVGLWAALTAVLAAPLTVGLVPPAQAQTGLSDAELLELESLLRDLGFGPGSVDGVVDEGTLAAIARYQDFASLPGDPEPSPALLGELRGVAAAFAALRNDDAPAERREETPASGQAAVAPEPAAPDTSKPEATPGSDSPGSPPPGADPSYTDPSQTGPSQADPSQADPIPRAEDGTATAKVVVPPPPAPPKLKPLDATPPAQPPAEPPVVAARSPDDEASAAGATGPAPPGDADSADGDAAPGDDAAAREARIEIALRPHRRGLADGSLSRDDLARQFNQDGRALLAQAAYEAAIAHFDVAIFLNPRFAGAYSNRGTAYELMGERELALEDFATARQLGFGGLRLQ
ncbi:peptidoglycan-binding protein [Pelagibius sp.]|uniref:peptidoglycan-binding protein n=1 Tax=Pelagibius sp. TaxID=1931238 RepID=UPI003B50C9F1